MVGCSVNNSYLHLIIADGSIRHFAFRMVVQANTVGEVDILGIGLLRINSGTILAHFIEIVYYLTDMEQKTRWHRETWCTNAMRTVCYNILTIGIFIGIQIFEI